MATIDCMQCDKEFEGEEPEYCCAGLSNMCGCMGQPIDGPIVCSQECYDKVMNNIGAQ